MNDIILKADNLHFSYSDGTNALCGVDLEIKRGQKVALLGANGSGKSTFFLCLNGIHKPTKGTLSLNGTPYNYSRKGLLALRQKVGIVFQDPDNQLFSANVYQEISFGILNLGVSETEAKQAVSNVISELEITQFQDKPTHFLSGGQKKQVAIADIVVMNPEIIILDEPAAALDPKHAKIVNQFVDSLIEKGITVLISTHDVDYAYAWADDIILFANGKVLMTGTPFQVFSNKGVLAQTNLNQPAPLELFISLTKKGILKSNLPFPKTLLELEHYIEQVKNYHYTGGNTKMSNTNAISSLDQVNKKAILAVSFGTSFHETRKKTIDKIQEDFQNAFPDYVLYQAWTSKMIIKKLQTRDQIKINTVTEAMNTMKRDGITQIIVQPTHIINGVENDIMTQEVLQFKHDFTSIDFGAPLLTTTQDNEDVIQALMTEFRHIPSDEALVFMGHGTTHYANSVYAALDYTFKEFGYSHVFLGTVEAYPSIETLLKLVQMGHYKKVHLAPFMVVAGDHAINDMSSEEADSWRSIFENAGYDVCCYLKGLGEYEGIRQIYLKHLQEAHHS